jgi:hypothetical protein
MNVQKGTTSSKLEKKTNYTMAEKASKWKLKALKVLFSD